MPGHMQNSLIFHYNLKFYGKDTDNYEGISLKRFVMQVRIIGWWVRLSAVECGMIFAQGAGILLKSFL